MSSSEQVTVEITRLRDAIKKKYQQMRYGEVDTDKFFSKKYKPIINELSKIRGLSDVKTEIKDEPMVVDEPSTTVDEPFAGTSTPRGPSFIETDTVAETPDTVAELLSTPQGRTESLKWVSETFQHPLTRRYMSKMMTDDSRKNTMDHVYGPRIENESLMVGDKIIQFTDTGEITIDGTNYKGTPGLYELLFKRVPKDGMYTQADLDAYKDICLKTNAHKRKYSPHGQVNRNPNSAKYSKIIIQLFPPKTISGKGYSYWDDPNELCDRLRLLLASSDAGHTGHANEIASIVEELRKAGVIKGLGNSKIRALIR